MGSGTKHNPGNDLPAHMAGTKKGEETARRRGREAGRDDPMTAFRTARDSTSINPSDMGPIDPRMPHLPPA